MASLLAACMAPRDFRSLGKDGALTVGEKQRSNSEAKGVLPLRIKTGGSARPLNVCCVHERTLSKRVHHPAHRRVHPVLDLHPVLRPAGLIWPVAVPRHLNPMCTQPETDPGRSRCEVLTELDAVACLRQQLGRPIFAGMLLGCCSV
jgi:hypothetical protein